MSINRINSNSRLSGAVTFGDLVFLSGQVPGDSTDVTGQTAEVLAKIDALLAEAGSDKDHLLNATIYLNDIGRDFRRHERGLVAVAVTGQSADPHHLAGATGPSRGSGGNHRDRRPPLIA